MDRGSKATLPLTIPRRVFKSSAKDSARRPAGIPLQGGPSRLVRRGGFHQRHGPLGALRPLLRVDAEAAGAGAACLAWILT